MLLEVGWSEFWVKYEETLQSELLGYDISQPLDPNSLLNWLVIITDLVTLVRGCEKKKALFAKW
jgi:hypothetical protein